MRLIVHFSQSLTVDVEDTDPAIVKHVSTLIRLNKERIEAMIMDRVKTAILEAVPEFEVKASTIEFLDKESAG